MILYLESESIVNSEFEYRNGIGTKLYRIQFWGTFRVSDTFQKVTGMYRKFFAKFVTVTVTSLAQKWDIFLRFCTKKLSQQKGVANFRAMLHWVTKYILYTYLQSFCYHFDMMLIWYRNISQATMHGQQLIEETYFIAIKYVVYTV